MMNEPIITLDIDWAPDFVIDFVADILREHQVRATWFVTHASAAIERLRKTPELFELGIHPNFLANSTHGSTIPDVLQHCMSLVPEARCMRTHSLYQSSPLLANVLRYTPIRMDVSLFLPRAKSLQPIEHIWCGETLRRAPFYWEDDFEMGRPDACWQVEPYLTSDDGLKIFNFHPIHIYLNSADMLPYQALKRDCHHLLSATLTHVDKHVQDGTGSRTIFLQLAQYLAIQRTSYCIRDI
ncbi:MAG: hypothetical protein AAF702_04100 [Chloroflexota bacterium]